jgi:soluble lytic murein transglycosylase-like protein
MMYDTLIEAYARQYGIPLELARRLIKTESAGNPQAVSPKGAMGLAQLMPGTAKDLGVTDPYDPEQNIRGGMQYLKQQYDRFGSWPLALAAYNAGPERVARAGGIPGIAETQNYVQQVTGGVPDISGRVEAKLPPSRVPAQIGQATDGLAADHVATGRATANRPIR